MTVGAIAVIAGCSSNAPESPSDPDASSPVGAPVLADDRTKPLVDALPTATGPRTEFERLDEGLVPPTNTWFSGLVLSEQPQPVFPLPLSFALTPSGVEFGVPEVSAQPGAISAPHAPSVVLDAGADSAVVTRYDEVSLTIALRSGDDAVAETSIARGSPVIGYTALVEHDVRLAAPVEAVPGAGEGIHSLTTPTATMLLVAPEAAVSADGATLTLPVGATANWVAVPLDADAPLERFAELGGSAVKEVRVSASVDDQGAETTLDYATHDGSDTVLGRLPHQGDEGCELGGFSTPYGRMMLCAATELSWSVPSLQPDAALPIDGSALTDDERVELVDALESDVGSMAETPPDTYFGGKALARLATMLQLARQLGQSDGPAADRARSVAQGLDERLRDELATWTEPQGCESRTERCFTYDPAVRGVVGREPSFGSDEFNDHHFHYGNFIYAAAVLAGATGATGDIDAEFVEQLRPVIDLLAADLASSGGELFPVSRAFDPYSGHSWASGFAPFADGNNQESSSEAVSAANALALWGQATGDEALAEQGRWMLSAESNAAQHYWLEFDRQAEPYASYERSVIGIVWDAKRDFGTWFSPEPSAVLGIQLLPMHPVAEYLGGDGERILASLDDVAPEGAETAAQFADYLLMYQALAGPEQAALALDVARELPAASIDDGNSRAYLLAWIMMQR